MTNREKIIKVLQKGEGVEYERLLDNHFGCPSNEMCMKWEANCIDCLTDWMEQETE